MKEIAAMVCDMNVEKAEYEFFDVNCWLPFNDSESFSPIVTMDAFESELSFYGIKCAVVSNSRCFTCSPTVGNDELISWTGSADSLYAGAVLAPEAGFVPYELHKYIDRLIENKVVVIRMFPKKLNHSIKKWQTDDIFSYLEYKKLPLMLWHSETDWDTLSEICSQYPDLNVIVEGNDKKLLYHNRDYLQLLKRYNNLYIETHNLVQYLGLEYITGRLSVDRLIFGTYFPFNDPNSAILPVLSADINDTVKHRIAGGNLYNMINNIKHE